MYRRKYLDEQNVEWNWAKGSKHQFQFETEMAFLGFPSFETWNLDLSMIYCLYERVKCYLDFDFVDLTAKNFTFEDKECTQQELIDELLRECEAVFNGNDLEESYYVSMRRIWLIWAEICPAMWW